VSGEPEMTSRRSEGEHRGRIELPREELERRLNEVAERLVELYLLGASGEQLKCRIRELHEGLSRFSGWDKEKLRERFLRCYLIHETQFQQLTVARRFAGPPSVACFLLDLLLAKADRAAIPGDLAEEFTASILPKYGARRARLWFWTQTVRTIATRSPVCRWALVGGLVRVGEWIFRQIGS
jgi:hypothetical protein